MAKKTKKNENLTLEEKLEQVIVPNWDEPYKLHNNWCWTTLGTVCSLDNGAKISDLELPYLDAKTLRGNIESIYRNSGTIVEKNQKVILVDGENSGEVFVVPFRGYMGSTFRILKISDVINEDYAQLFIVAHRDELRKNKTGTAIPHLNKELFFELKIPIPPLEEQKRIADLIEAFFSKLDEAKEKAQEVIDGFESRRAAILHKAFSGELTAMWRKDRFDKNYIWEDLTLNDVAEYKKGPFGSSITKAMFVPKGEKTYKVYEQGNAIRKTVDYGHYYISEEKYIELKGFAIKGGDIIVSCAGTIGEVYKLPIGCEKGVINQALMRVRIFSNIEESFFIYYFGEVLKGDVNANARGIAIKNIPPFKVMKAMPIKLPCIKEQQEIVRILDDLLSKEQQTKEIAEATIEKIDLMKKSILAHAFRGELGTNDPNDESAIELLKQILEEKNNRQKEKLSALRLTIPKEVSEQLSSELEKKIVKEILKNGGSADFEKILTVSSKKFDILYSVRMLEKKELIIRNESGEYTLKR